PLIAVEPAGNPFADEKLPVIDFTAITPYQLVHAAKDIPGKKIHHIIVGGSQVTSAMEKLVSGWKSIVYETFGMTGTASHIALRCINGIEKSSYFHTLDGVALSLDKRGCLVIDAPHLSAEKLITNDLVELKDSHTFRWMGRIDRVINSGGIKIFPEQVECKLQSLIDRPFFIVSRPDERLGQQVVLVLESRELSDLELTEFHLAMKSQLDRYEVPGKIICVPEFVYSAGNKVLRKETLELLKNTLSE
ncbi:MAG: O-succinylbenzoic acid--CoA ligase, partial [Paludibacter sp.]|nr:O-succinylbenzoic acid--CoA ligase [Paludibacter sp.]